DLAIEAGRLVHPTSFVQPSVERLRIEVAEGPALTVDSRSEVLLVQLVPEVVPELLVTVELAPVDPHGPVLPVCQDDAPHVPWGIHRDSWWMSLSPRSVESDSGRHEVTRHDRRPVHGGWSVVGRSGWSIQWTAHK